MIFSPDDFYNEDSDFQEESMERDVDIREIYEISQSTMQLETIQF